MCDKKKVSAAAEERSVLFLMESVGTVIKTQFTRQKNWGANIAISHCPSTRVNKPFS